MSIASYFVIHILQYFITAKPCIQGRDHPIIKNPCAHTQLLMVEMSRKGINQANKTLVSSRINNCSFVRPHYIGL